MRKIAFFGICVFALLLVACGTDNKTGQVKLENTVALCTDGLDNDGDGNFDCYDANCRALDSTMRLKGDTLCHYENYHPIFALSSAVLQSSSSTASSSSAQAATNSGFPMNVVNSNYDTIQILTLYRKANSIEVAMSGRMDNQALTGIVDTLGAPVQTPAAFQYSKDPVDSVAGVSNGHHFYGIDTSLTGNYLFYGSLDFPSLSRPASYNYIERGMYFNEWPHMPSTSQFRYVGNLSSAATCFVFNVADSGFVEVDDNLTDLFIPYPSTHNNMPHTRMVAGALDNGTCIGVGQSTVGDSSQIRIGVASATNAELANIQITMGSKNEVVYDLAIANGTYYLATTVDGYPKVIMLNSSLNKINTAATAADLGSGTPSHIRSISIGGVQRMILVGSSGAYGAIWILDAQGNKLFEYLDNGTGGLTKFTDVVQLESGNLIVAGYKSTTKGTAATIKKFALTASPLSLKEFQ